MTEVISLWIWQRTGTIAIAPSEQAIAVKLQSRQTPDRPAFFWNHILDVGD